MIDDIYTLTLRGRLQSQVIENILWYAVSADSDYTSLCTALYTHAFTNILPACAAIQSADFEWTTITAQKVWPIPAFFPNAVPVSILGTVANTSMPAEVALVITKRTILAGPRWRGRMYLAGIPQQAMDAITGLWDAMTVTGADAIGTQLIASVSTAVPGGVLNPILWNRVGHTYTVLNSCVGRSTPRAQRRRQIGRGI